jgi:hypothetical protein
LRPSVPQTVAGTISDRLHVFSPLHITLCRSISASESCEEKFLVKMNDAGTESKIQALETFAGAVTREKEKTSKHSLTDVEADNPAPRNQNEAGLEETRSSTDVSAELPVKRVS